MSSNNNNNSGFFTTTERSSNSNSNTFNATVNYRGMEPKYFDAMERDILSRTPEKAYFLFSQGIINCLARKKKKFQGQLNPKHGVSIFLYWLYNGSSFRQLEDVTGMGHETCRRIIKVIMRHCDEFVASFVSMMSSRYRLEASRINGALNEFDLLTLICDGTHTPFKLPQRNREEIKKHHSFKTKKASLNTVLFMTKDDRWTFCSESFPAGSHLLGRRNEAP